MIIGTSYFLGRMAGRCGEPILQAQSQKEQEELFDEIIGSGLDIRIVKFILNSTTTFHLSCMAISPKQWELNKEHHKLDNFADITKKVLGELSSKFPVN